MSVLAFIVVYYMFGMTLVLLIKKGKVEQSIDVLFFLALFSLLMICLTQL